MHNPCKSVAGKAASTHLLRHPIFLKVKLWALAVCRRCLHFGHSTGQNDQLVCLGELLLQQILGFEDVPHHHTWVVAKLLLLLLPPAGPAHTRLSTM